MVVLSQIGKQKKRNVRGGGEWRCLLLGAGGKKQLEVVLKGCHERE